MIKTELPSPAAARPLSESEIQDRLYGNYFGKKKAPPSEKIEKVWTGSEILTGELHRLRSEMIALRQEKERLALKLEQASRSMPAPKPDSETGSWVSKLFAFVLLLGAVGYLIGAAALQASPAVGERTPYTVQVGVYDGKGMADRAQGLLKELGYDAFLVEMPRAGGTVRYRIYVGTFVTKEEAARASQRLASDTRFRDFKDAFVLVR